MHLVTERRGKPVRVRLTAGQRHESTIAHDLLDDALHRLWPDAVAGDKASSTAAIRTRLQAREIEAVIPKRENELGSHEDDPTAYRGRPIIERTFNRLKRFRRIATRYEKLAATYLAMVTLACILEWL